MRMHDINEKQISMPSKFSTGDEVAVIGHPTLRGTVSRMLPDGVAMVHFDIAPGHKGIESEVDLSDLEPATVHESKMSRLDAELDNPEIDDDIHDPNISDEEFEDKYGMSKEIAKMFRDAAINDKPIFDPKHDRWTEYGDPIHEKLDANQRRAGQAGPTDKAPLRGKLVGGGLEEGGLNKIANKVMGAAPKEPAYKVGQKVKYETNPHQPDWVDGGRGVGVITDYKNGHYIINGNPVNHFEIKGVVEQGVAEGDVFFIEMGSTLIETTVLRANHDTVLLAADDTAMSLLEASAVMEAEYHGRKVPLGKPMQGDVKKFKVYVKDPKTGNVKKVNFGDPNMRIKKSNPARRKSFRARHNCANPGPRTKARYWSCRKW